MSVGPLYFGCWGGTGHFLSDARGHMARDIRREFPLHERRVDGAFCGDPALAEYQRDRTHWRGDEEHQPEGRARLHHIDGWTVLAFWDRSVDDRFGSNSAFLLPGILSATEAHAAAKAAFPAVWDRFRFAVVLP